MNTPAQPFDPKAIGPQLLLVRRRWHHPGFGRVEIRRLREVRLRSDPGGICADFPRAFLAARVWCDQLTENCGLHACNPASAPHELEVWVLEADNERRLIEALRLTAR